MNNPLPRWSTELLSARTVEEIDAWVSAGGSTGELYRAIAANVNWPSLPAIKAWVQVQSDRTAQRELELNERATEAAERSAKSAKHSALAASIAVGISLVALCVSVVQFVLGR